MDVADKIIMLMKRKEMNKTQLAEKSGLSRSTINSLLSRKSMPRDHTLEAICKALDKTVEAFHAEGYTPPGLTDKETRLLERYREFSEISQDAFLAVFEKHGH